MYAIKNKDGFYLEKLGAVNTWGPRPVYKFKAEQAEFLAYQGIYVQVEVEGGC